MRRFLTAGFLFLAVLSAALILGACGQLSDAQPAADPSALPMPSPSPSATPSPAAGASPSQTPIPPGSLPVWSTYPAPIYTPVTPVPPPFGRLALPEEMQVLLLVGLDREQPFVGRGDAILLVLYHPRLAKVSLVSVPPDLFGYLPGYTMQRLSSAYPIGGERMLADALEYNLGVRPDDYLVARMDDFSILVDELNGLAVPVLEVIPLLCDDILYPGTVLMTGDQAACYASLRFAAAESARGLRQQQLLVLVLQRLVQSGNLTRLPELYDLFRTRVETSLTSRDMFGSTNLLLKLGDPSRVAYFQLGENETSLWEISEQPPATVFLPRRAAISALFEDAIAFANEPKSLSDVIVTLEYEMTISPTPTIQPTLTPRPTITDTPVFTVTTTGTITLTPTITATPTVTVTHTLAP